MLRLLAKISVFFILFPYVVTLRTESDIQPNALIFNLLFILFFMLLHNMRVPFSYAPFIFSIVFLYSIVVPSLLDSVSLRGIVPYASLVIFSLSGYLMFRKELFSSNIIKYAVWIWLFFGLAQILLQPEFGYFLLPRGSTSMSRGVVSLAPEPSYYGIICLFMTIAIDMLLANGMFSAKSAKKYKILLIFQMVFLAQSFTAVFLYLIYLASSVIVTVSLKRLVKTAAYSIGALLLLVYVNEKYGIGGSRFGFLLNTLLSNPMMLMSEDVSAVQRMADIYMSLYGFYDSLPFAIGHGTTAFSAFVSEHLDMLLPNYPGKWDDRIMSGYGAPLFELGYIGILIPLITFISFWKNGTTRMKGIGLFLVISMFSAIPLSFPLYSFLIGMSEAFRRKHPESASPGKFRPQHLITPGVI